MEGIIVDITKTNFTLNIEEGTFNYKEKEYHFGQILTEVKNLLGENIEDASPVMKSGRVFVYLPKGLFYGLSVSPTFVFKDGIFRKVTFETTLCGLGEGFFSLKEDNKALEKNVSIIKMNLKQVFPDGYDDKNGDFCVESKDKSYALYAYATRDFDRYIIYFSDNK